MAATIKALNARIRSNKVADYFCSTHFWGPASNFGIPLAAIADLSKDPDINSLNELPSTSFLKNKALLRTTITDHDRNPTADFTTSISGRMTLALTGYSGTFMRYALAVQPRNWLLFGCHVVNFGSQTTQGYRFVNYWYMGGREQKLREEAQMPGSSLDQKAQNIAEGAKDVGRKAEAEVQKGVDKVKRE
ncbi:MAG: hypothetical protein M1831_006755 [Alyxoria varia]|nr:MAG: hypothetical protein M1831_006755 [Alyxoria varia]